MGAAMNDFRSVLKAVEFKLYPRGIRLLAPFVGLQNPFVSTEYCCRAIFIHVPKAAGTSVARALFGQKSRHIPLARYYAFDNLLAQQCFKFSFVRNPWDRFQSAYHYLAKRIGADPSFSDHRWATHYLGQTPDFEAFVRRMMKDRGFRAIVRRYIHFRDQADWLQVPGQGMPVEFLGRFETLAEDFEIVRGRLSRGDPLPHERKGTSVDYRAVYSPESIDFVGDLYERDSRLFTYDF